MSATQSKNITANCTIIWGAGEYDIDIETDDYVNYICYVKRDFGNAFGPPLTVTAVCSSSEQAWSELDRMLTVWARQVQSRQPMS